MSIKVGFSQRNITPQKEDKVYLDGFAHREGRSTGIRDDLFVRACLIESQGREILILNFDLCGVGGKVYELFNSHIMETGIKEEDTIITATHTHAGPATGNIKGLGINFDYWNLVGKKIQELIKEAREKAEEGTFSLTFSNDLDIGFDRRDNKEIDKEIKVLSFHNLKGEKKGIIAKASCHPVIETRYLVSADYVSVLNREMKVPTLLFQGNSGNINPKYEEITDIDERIEKVGGLLFDKVVELLEKEGESFSFDKFNIVSKRLSLPMEDLPSLEELEEKIKMAKDKYEKQENALYRKIDKRVHDWYSLLYEKKKTNADTDLNAQVQILRLSGQGKKLVFFFLPFELFFSTTRKIYDGLAEKGYKEEEIFVVGYSKQSTGYLIPAEVCHEGGYEVREAPKWSNHYYFSPKTEGTLLENLFNLVEDMK